MTIGAIQTLRARMVAMTKDRLEDVPAGGRAPVGCELVADIARPDLTLGCMTGITVCMRPYSDRQSLPGACRFMTRRASLWRTALARDVRGVDELHIEALDEPRWKLLESRRVGLHVRVADHAHLLLIGICKLADMTPDARVVTGELEIKRRAFALVTRVTFKLLVFGDRVRKIREASVGRANGDCRRGFGRCDDHRCLWRPRDAAADEDKERTADDKQLEQGFCCHLSEPYGRSWLGGAGYAPTSDV